MTDNISINMRKVKIDELNVPPAYIDDKGLPTISSNARLVLVTVNAKRGMWNTELVKGEKVWVRSISAWGKTYGYIDLNEIGCLTQKTSSLVAGLINCATPFMDLGQADVFREVFDEEGLQLPSWDEVKRFDYDWIGSIKDGKMTSWHHVHLLPTQALVAAAHAGRLKHAILVAKKLKNVQGLTRAMFSTFITYTSMVPEEQLKIWTKIIHKQSAVKVEILSKYLKQISIMFKQLQHVFETDLSPLFELDVLINRGVGDVDWEKEKEARTKGKMVQLPVNVVYNRAAELFQTAKDEGRYYRSRTYAQWAEFRLLTTPGGAAHSYNPLFSDIIRSEKKDKNLDFNKKFLLSMNRPPEFENLSSRKPRIDAWPSTKYEWGKQRAIYGTDVDSYILADLALPMCEHMFPSMIIGGANAEEGRLRRIVSQVMNGGMPLCFDYEDFNSQHTVQSMSEVLRAFYKVWSGSMTREQTIAMEWTIRSVEDMRVNGNPTLGVTPYRLRGTLLSGWRLTTFINSMLNRIYLEESGSIEDAMYAIHSGDDVLASVVSLNDAMSFIKKAEAIGVRAQISKMNISSIAEFLRIDHKGQTTASQYLTRAVATIVHSRMETSQAYDSVEYIEATRERIQNASDRGGMNVNHVWAELKTTIKKTQKISEATIEYTLAAHRLEGGLSELPRLTGVRVVSTSGFTRPHPDTYLKVDKIMPGITDTARGIVKKLGWSEDNRLGEIVNYIVDTEAEKMNRVRGKKEIAYYNVSEVQEAELSRFRDYRGLIKLGVAGMLRGADPKLVRLLISMQTELGQALLGKVKNFSKVMRLMF
uniref:RNA-directed RNA polymerase n=1 Tax=Porphyridium purpureum toti-like virus 1 TaxID=2933123 RepID=A0A9C7GWI0_9VIRU|nr:RNA-dependent RNA polymerase [Porphyridium purpureum toti-like virus 1]CAI5383886.1 RNA-dependent RNA polymerase [Porphyridium purpureum toti-like virus 1]